ncbi:MAG: ankyrin repeat domain-containing protein [Longimicrobiales bacterium]
MSSSHLPAHPHLDHLKHQARALQGAFLRGDAVAVERVRAVIGPTTRLKLTEAQLVIAREYGFSSWAKLRTHVQASRGVDEAADAFLAAVTAGDAGRALDVLRSEPRIASTRLHVAAVLGLDAEVRRLVAEDAAQVNTRAGHSPADPLLWLCYSPFHGESPQRDDGLAAAARILLDSGADANTRDAQHGVPALYAVTGHRNVPRIARLLLEAGANPNDGESVFHAAQLFHEEALDLLLQFNVDLNFTGDWGNTPLHFLLSYRESEWEADRVNRGLSWLLEHGADPDVRSGRDRETALHAAARRGWSPEIVQQLLAHGADVHARRADGRTAWVLARRSGFHHVAALLEHAGAAAESLAPADALMAACARGDASAARRLASPEARMALDTGALRLLPEAAAEGHRDVVRSCLAAGFPADSTDAFGATALHNAAIRGRARIVRDLLEHGADFNIRDPEHASSPMGWACFGADVVAEPGGDYADCVRALLEAGARLSADEHVPRHAGVLEVLRTRERGAGSSAP